MKVVVYIRAADERFLKEHLLYTDVPSWVRQVVQRAIDVTKEKEKRERDSE
jgi:hypothetical protein